MSYQDQAGLLGDAGYVGRAHACVREQALVFVADERPEYVNLAREVIAAPTSGATYNVVALTTSRPGMTAASSDGDILAAVQYVWPLAGAGYV